MVLDQTLVVLELLQLFQVLNISVENPNGKESGFSKFVVNGEEYSDNYIPADKLTKETEVKIVM